MPQYKVINEDQGHKIHHLVTAPDKETAITRISNRCFGKVVDAWEVDKHGERITKKESYEHGLTKREYIATQILAGLIAGRDNSEGFNYQERANQAVVQTDYLIKKLES